MRKRRPPAGAPPGALGALGSAEPAIVTVYSFGSGAGLSERRVDDLGELAPLVKDTSRRHWIDVQGLDDVATLRRIAELFDIHPLALADIVNTPQRPKAEAYGELLLMIVQMVRARGTHLESVEQLSIVTAGNVVLTFQERELGDVLDPVRERLRKGGGPLFVHEVDYLTYAVLDTVIDGYFPVLESLGEEIEEVEREVFESADPSMLGDVQRVKRELLTLRRHLWPQRDALAAVLREDARKLSEAARFHLRDTYDHTVQLIDILENHRELASNLTEAYMSSLSHRLNEIMKVLAVISTLFMPLSFLTGVYGMNFEYMPELHAPYAFPTFIGIMTAIAAGMLWAFWRRGWLGSTEKHRRRRREHARRKAVATERHARRA